MARASTSANIRPPKDRSGRPRSSRGNSVTPVSAISRRAASSMEMPTGRTGNPSLPSLSRNGPVVANSTWWPAASAASANGIIG